MSGDYKQESEKYKLGDYVPENLYENGWNKVSFYVISEENPKIKIWFEALGLTRMFWGSSGVAKHADKKDIIDGTIYIFIRESDVWQGSICISEYSESAFLIYADRIRINRVENI